MKATGGYLLLPTDLVRASDGEHTPEVDRPISQEHLDALNAIQATPWRVNQFVLDVAAEAWTRGLPLAGLGETHTVSVPDRKPSAEWEAMTPEERRGHQMAQRAAYEANLSAAGRLSAILECLAAGQEMRHRDAFWFPYSLDFRGRVYPVGEGPLNPQGRDLAKGLLMFAEGKPLGSDGEFWLCVRAANCAGMDKLGLAERVGWALDHATDIQLAASAPFDFPWWADLPDPWSFLATAYELNCAWLSGNPADWVSHLPIPMDGTCSGLQHLSAMGLDPVGARATNLCAGLPRQDIYAEVAALVATRAAEDAAAGNPLASWWAGRVDRSVAKRSVMTTPYGVTSRGIQQQLISDGFVKDAPPIERPALAAYLRDRLVEALEGTIVGAKEIMGWLQDTAASLAAAQVPFDWTTPAGSTFRQAYREERSVQVRTLVGYLKINLPNPTGGLLAGKAANAAAPNVIHSFDAAHMVKTVNQGNGEGISAWAMIHDSFGTHACQTTKLNAILRGEFVAMYREDWIAHIRDQVQSYAPHVALRPVPHRGSFDLSQVLRSEFFFS